MKTIFVTLCFAFSFSGLFAQDFEYSLEVEDVHEGPVIKKGDSNTQDNKYGFEGGTVIRYKNEYHLFTAERFGKPRLVKMRLANWKSKDGINWERLSTIFESSGNFTGEDKYASLWAPMPYFNKDEDRWNIFYVAYRSKPNDSTGWYLNYEGRIARAFSESPGYDGLQGPYKNAGFVLEPDSKDGDWVGLQGNDSFFGYQVENNWYAFYGSAQTQSNRNTKYPKHNLTMATAVKLAGPWEKLTEKGLVKFHEKFAENPVITKLDNGMYVALLDSSKGSFGYSFSKDGLIWEEARFIKLAPYTKKWWTTVRTPLCLIPENDGFYTVFFTAFTESGFAEVGKVKLKLIKK
ncbi:MAG: hypothetical protein GQ540_05480 [Lutibacter sp.]|uniref:hypothetical protein n=1 Tax=Lutibacter sp. TaxID=1925666 RepID=UPI001A103A1D|nr:hypothetical protein [Lutibacter sp.]NOR27960.1 hypothetical protein [Lutibacter sp.]